MPAPDAAHAGVSRWPAVLTWRGDDAPRMESVRVQIAGRRIKAVGRIIGGECPQHPAFSASYDLVTDESGTTRRLSLRATVAGGERHTSISRDAEGYWLIDDGEYRLRSLFDGAFDVDVVLSPFFNALPIRRLDLGVGIPSETVVPVVYVDLPDLAVREATLTYIRTETGFKVLSPVIISGITIDEDGFLIDYSDLARRI